MSMGKTIATVAAGALFGFGLALSTMIRPEVVLSFLQLRDFGLALVMGGYALAMHWHLSGPLAMAVAGLWIGNQGVAEAMSAETELVPVCRMCGWKTNTGEMIMKTAMVSPRARPRPSIVPPIMPPLPKGRTTERIIPHFVAPRA